jgi:beta-xylosidase
MSSNGGRTVTTAAGRWGIRGILAWSAIGLVCLAGLIGAIVFSHARASATDPARVLHSAPAALTPFNATAPPVDRATFAPGSEVPAGIDQSDPFVTVAGDRFVLVASGGAAPSSVNVPLTTSTDFTHWTPPVDALPVLPPWTERGFTWAPDLHRFGSTYALYFTAALANHSPPTQCVGSAFASSPTGPFTPSPTPIVCQLDQGGTIDPRVFVDHTGTPWLLFKSDQNIGGSPTPTIMWSERLSPDGTRLIGRPSVLLMPDRPWQGTIVEAPDMVEVNGAYWVFYSANWYNSPNYAVGAARCASPAGPCADLGTTPLLASNFQGEGPGEASVFRDPAGIWLLYSPRRSLAPQPDVPARPVYIARIGFTRSGPYLARGPLPGATDLLAIPLWSTAA